MAPGGRVAMKHYTLQMKKDVAQRLRNCRASIRQSIERKLQEIIAMAAEGRPAKPRSRPIGPPLRFYVFEGYRVSYEVNPLTRKVLVLELRNEPG